MTALADLGPQPLCSAKTNPSATVDRSVDGSAVAHGGDGEKVRSTPGRAFYSP
jgi:hypothetical protein